MPKSQTLLAQKIYACFMSVTKDLLCYIMGSFKKSIQEKLICDFVAS